MSLERNEAFRIDLFFVSGLFEIFSITKLPVYM